jgi:hypothetical protein
MGVVTHSRDSEHAAVKVPGHAEVAGSSRRKRDPERWTKAMMLFAIVAAVGTLFAKA